MNQGYKYKQILVFGDSIVWGAWDEKGRWVNRLRMWVDTKNLASSGFSLSSVV